MKQFVIFIGSIFLILTAIYLNTDQTKAAPSSSTIKVYASSSFISKWGPGQTLAELFEKQNGVKVDFIESSDVAMTLQKISFEGKNAIGDVVVGLDQFDISRTAKKIKWVDLKSEKLSDYAVEIKAVSSEKRFLPYDWAPMAFVRRDSSVLSIDSLDDLLKPDLKSKIALQDPRTSSPGLQFLVWIFETKGLLEGKEFLKKINSQVHSYSAGWSTAYGLFKTKQAELVFSYMTSPVYHLVEEKDSAYASLEFKEPHPLQVEFAGVPETCRRCELAVKFVQFLQTPEAQKIIMNKNYMLPITPITKESTPFDAVKIYKTKAFKIYDKNQLDDWIQIWSEIRKNES